MLEKKSESVASIASMSGSLDPQEKVMRYLRCAGSLKFSGSHIRPYTNAPARSANRMSAGNMREAKRRDWSCPPVPANKSAAYSVAVDAVPRVRARLSLA
jgi:hypothetical protein